MADDFLEFSEDHSQDIWALDSQHGCDDVFPFRLGAPPPNMVLEVLFLFNNGADLVVEDLTYLTRLRMRSYLLCLKVFRDSLRFRAYFGCNLHFKLLFFERAPLDLLVSL
jgi:hypothetical protein